jgi:tripartite-type tricarboxylate transporter receptor subunit TctC
MLLRSALRLGMATAALALAGAASAEDFYKGKSITIFIGSGAGGGFDTYARVVGRHLGKHIPGNPNIIPNNRPGAGGRGNANLLYNRDPKDGTALGHIGPWLALEPLWGQEGVQFEPAKFNWLITMSQETSTCLWWKQSGVNTIQDLIKRKTGTTGASGPTSSQASDAFVLNSVLKLNLKILFGFKGTREVSLASERGELDGACGLWWASVKSQYMEPVNAGRANIILQLGNRRHPELDQRGVPFLGDLIKDAPQIDKDAVSIIFSMMDVARPFVAPPGVPADRVQLLRKAFMATAKDKDFIEEATKRKLDLDPKSGEEVQTLIEAMYKHPPETVAHAKKMINP